MGGRDLVRSPAAVAFTALGVLVVLPVVALGWRLAVAVGATGVATDPSFLGGFGQLLYLLILVAVVLLSALLWLPVGAAIAYAVGRRARGRPGSVGASVSRVRDVASGLCRWVKTRAAVGPLDGVLLSEADVHPSEVGAGCWKFVVPALVLDAPTLPAAVDRANRVPPSATRGWTVFASLGTTTVAVAAVFAWATVTRGRVTDGALVVAATVAVVGVVVSAALDTAWRARVYATTDQDDGFRTR